MSVLAVIAILFLGGVVAAIAARFDEAWPKWIGLGALVACAPAVLSLFTGGGLPWRDELRLEWIPALGATFHLAVDGLSAILIALTWVLGLGSVVVSWEVRERTGFYFLNLLWVLAGVVGVFSAIDLLLFFVFWEVMLVPMYFLIALWGYEERERAAMKFFIFTQASGMLLLAAIVACVWLDFQASGTLTFDYEDLRGRDFGGLEPWLMLGFVAAFAVKLPVVPLHTWLPDAHTQAPTAASVLLAGILLKTGAYGLLRFVLPLFPQTAYEIAPAAMAFGVFGIFYGALLAFGQRDMKRLVAYSSVSHMGFVVLGVFAFNKAAHAGVVLQLVAHGFSTGALFVVVGALQSRLHTRDLERMGGLWGALPRLSAFGMFFAIASLGLPGLANFAAEFLVLFGTYAVAPFWATLAALGLIAAAVYSLAIVQRAFHGAAAAGAGGWADASWHETAVLGLFALLLLWFGVAPQPLIDRVVEEPLPVVMVRR